MFINEEIVRVLRICVELYCNVKCFDGAKDCLDEIENWKPKDVII